MTNALRSTAFKAFYVARFLLELAGIFLVILGVFIAVLTYTVRHGEHGIDPRTMIFGAVFSLLSGIGLMLPMLWAKFVSSSLLVAAGAWLCAHDMFWRLNLRIYLFFVIPLFLSIWLKAGYAKFEIERLPNADQI